MSRLRFRANLFRLPLHAAAYWPLDRLHAELAAAGVERTQLDTLQLRVAKIGGGVRQLADRVRLHLAAAHPGPHPWPALAAARGTAPRVIQARR